MRIIDTHTHIYPDKIADKATKSIGDFYNLKMNCVGSISELLKSGEKVGVEKYIVHSVAIAPDKVTTINNFVYEATQQIDKFVGYMTMHPSLSEKAIENEIERCINLGLRGIKMHPDIQQFDINCKNAIKIYEIAQDRLPILLHTGDERYSFSLPEKLSEVAKMFPKTTFIGAHFGGYSRWDEVDCYLETPNVYFDTSSALFKLSPMRATELINNLGAHRFFFGTDFPVISHEDELSYFSKLNLTETERQDILANNAVRILNV